MRCTHSMRRLLPHSSCTVGAVARVSSTRLNCVHTRQLAGRQHIIAREPRAAWKQNQGGTLTVRHAEAATSAGILHDHNQHDANQHGLLIAPRHRAEYSPADAMAGHLFFCKKVCADMGRGARGAGRWLLPVLAMWMVGTAAAVPADLLGSSGVRKEVCDALRGRQMVGCVCSAVNQSVRCYACCVFGHVSAHHLLRWRLFARRSCV